MNLDQVKGQWKQLKGHAKEFWGDLTDDEIEQAEGDREKLIGMVQKRYGKTREAAEKEVDDFLNRL
ncbi:Uncharacterized conserved protein YjbJ, UPF0337 family [Rhodovulum sp. ES.010]|uniref:CsbD family protein n=1 Tax=Rhodovulum sp. ES.010 TaxID=1882821 RepID=UPI0009270E70|nr:CsbD family protein [Rhodovulum sp. ES.010]SIO13597.1 Uncharacterized conserved protein YjbJ, UPF0337 family [Rhodovulum sp. ES.010]